MFVVSAFLTGVQQSTLGLKIFFRCWYFCASWPEESFDRHRLEGFVKDLRCLENHLGRLHLHHRWGRGLRKTLLGGWDESVWLGLGERWPGEAMIKREDRKECWVWVCWHRRTPDLGSGWTGYGWFGCCLNLPWSSDTPRSWDEQQSKVTLDPLIPISLRY